MTSATDRMTFQNAAAMGLSREEWELITQRLAVSQTFVNSVYFLPCGPNIVLINHQKNG